MTTVGPDGTGQMVQASVASSTASRAVAVAGREKKRSIAVASTEVHEHSSREDPGVKNSPIDRVTNTRLEDDRS